MPSVNEPNAEYFLKHGQSLQARRHINADGSTGGLVPIDVDVPNDVYLGKDVIVLPGVEISPGAHISGRCVIGPSIS